MRKKELEKRIDSIQKEAVLKQGKNINLPKDKNDQRVTKRTDYLHCVIALAEFDTNSKLIGHTKRVHITGGENLKQYQTGLIKISIKDGQGNPISAIIHGDVLIMATKQALDPKRLADEVEKNKSDIIKV